MYSLYHPGFLSETGGISKKTTMIAIILVMLIMVLILSVAGYFYLISGNKVPSATVPDTVASQAAADKIVESVASATLPDVSAPDNVNPAAAANPMNAVKTNPFE